MEGDGPIKLFTTLKNNLPFFLTLGMLSGQRSVKNDATESGRGREARTFARSVGALAVLHI